ncbi:hypothetical protein RhiirC2_771647 [Rhizophagus irregularis]|uniref:Uncharacterized protein n=1 Tax=Rhizophagus irregularis TaxID=588596 RepID=A0A2N1NTH5_9GLOM|nr:hypothetical protein RhiirC2_771647 [Rhizophagus irregularis]
MTLRLLIFMKEFSEFISKVNLKYKERIGIAVSEGVDNYRLREKSTKKAFQVSNILFTLGKLLKLNISLC